MKIAIFSTKPYDQAYFEKLGKDYPFEFTFIEAHLDEESVPLAKDHDVVCCFVNDRLSKPVVESLSQLGVRLIALRSAGFNNVDLATAKAANIPVVRVPAYSPYAVAEHAIALIQTLNRKTHRAYNRVREENFSIDGLMGFDLYGKTIGLIGTGKIGRVMVDIMKGFGCRVLAYDIQPGKHKSVEYVSLDELLSQSDIVSLHCPLTADNQHMINAELLAKMKKGVMLINTSRGGLIDTKAVIDALKSSQIGALGLDVYEDEASLFFDDHSNKILQDDIFARLLTFPNVIITSHQAFFTEEAMSNIVSTTLENIESFEQGKLINQL